MIFDFILGVLATIGCTVVVLVIFTYFSELYSNTCKILDILERWDEEDEEEEETYEEPREHKTCRSCRYFSQIDPRYAPLCTYDNHTVSCSLDCCDKYKKNLEENYGLESNK